MVYYNRCKMYMKQGNFEKAEEGYLKTIEMDDKDPEGYYYLAKMHVQQNKHFKAVRNFSKAIERIEAGLGYYISDDYGDEIPLNAVYLERGKLYELVEEYELMCEDYRKACALSNCKNPFPEGKQKVYEQYCK